MERKNSRCCCCNIKVGTSILAILFLVTGIMGVACASYALANPNSMSKDISWMDAENNTWNLSFTFTKTATFKNGLALACSIGLALIAVTALFGINKNRAGFLWPLMAVQIVVFIRTFFSMLFLMLHWSRVRIHIALCDHLPEEAKSWLLSLNNPALGALIFGGFAIGLMVKIYLMLVVYRCIVHLKEQRSQMRSGSEIDPEPQKEKCAFEELPEKKDIQKVPLVDDAEEICVNPPPYSI